MPQRDTIHYVVKEAISKDGWEITDDPFVISYGERLLILGRLRSLQKKARKVAFLAHGEGIK